MTAPQWERPRKPRRGPWWATDVLAPLLILAGTALVFVVGGLLEGIL